MERVGIGKLADEVIAGKRVERAEALTLCRVAGADVWELLSAANRVRHHFLGDRVSLCAIVNAKSGGCTEDCAFCAQSASHQTGVAEYGFIDDELLREAMERARRDGAAAFSIVAAWRGLSEGPQLRQVLDSIRTIAADGRLIPHASLGMIESRSVANQLAEAGVRCYNHNLETSRRFFDNICTTHTYDDRLRTLRYLKEAGIEVCSGVLIGMGEEWADRVDAAIALRELEVKTVPINFLHRIDGTALSTASALTPMEALRTVAVFRMLLPRANIMAAGGREAVLGDLLPLLFFAGASAAIVGGYLTTGGRRAEDDKRMMEQLGLRI